jgi:uncharacterized protein (TIGR04206 family)
VANSSKRAVLWLCLLAAVPWVVQFNTLTDLTAVMSWGLLNTDPWHVLPLPAYLGETQGLTTLPRSLQVWPLGLAFYAGAVVSAASGVVFGREDVRVTAGLLALTAVDSVVVWWGLLGRGTRGAIPVGVVVIAVVLWWFYWPVFSEFTGSNRREQ